MISASMVDIVISELSKSRHFCGEPFMVPPLRKIGRAADELHPFPTHGRLATCLGKLLWIKLGHDP